MISLNNLFEVKKRRRKHDHWYSKNIYVGAKVDIVLKKDQRTGKKTTGYVDSLLTKKGRHTQGIKVRLTDGQVGRVQEIYNDSD